jgi:hypothetical protein
MTNDQSAFENGERVPMSQMSQAPDEILADALPKELQDILERKLTEQQAVVVWEAITRFALAIMQHKNPQLTVTAFAFAAGLYVLQGKSVTELAKELGVTKQALSKRIVLITQELGLPPSRGMKSVEARESYRKAHTKPMKGKTNK